MNRNSENGKWVNLVFSFRQNHAVRQKNKGQAVVEFTLIFVLFLVIAWIPADFGLAFFTGQLALSASREGARIAAADPTLLSNSLEGTCTLPCTGASDILARTASRLSSALLPGATISVVYDPPNPPPPATPIPWPACSIPVRVRVHGTHTYFFYQILNLLGVSVNPTVDIDYFTDMRWEHQC